MEIYLEGSFLESLEKSTACLNDVLEDASRTNSKVLIEIDENNLQIIQNLRKTIEENKREFDDFKILKNQEISSIYQEKLSLLEEIERLYIENDKKEQDFENFKRKSFEEQETLFERIKRQQNESQNKFEALKRSFDEDSERHIKEKALMFNEYQILLNKNLDVYAKFESYKEEKELEITKIKESFDENMKKQGFQGENMRNQQKNAEKIEDFIYSLDFIVYLLQEYIFSGKDKGFQDVIEKKAEDLKTKLLEYKHIDKPFFPDVPSDEKSKKSAIQQLKFDDFDSFEFMRKNSHKVWHKSEQKFYTLKNLIESSECSINTISQQISLWESLENSRKPLIIPKFYGLFLENSSIYHLCFDYFPYSLRNLLESQKSQSLPLSLDKILDFAEKLINGLAFLQSLEIYHSELLPETIFLDESLEKLYILDISQSQLQEIKVNNYSSPEIDNAFQDKEKNSINFNRFKSDVFTLALILLEIGVLEVVKKDKDPKIWKKTIKDSMQEFTKKYGKMVKDKEEEKKLKGFSKILKKCLKMDAKKRLDFIDLYYKFNRK